MRDNRWGGTVPAVLFAALLSGVACFCPVLALSAPDSEIAFSEVDAGKISLVRSKLLRGADPDRVNEDGQSLLWEAAYRGEDRMVRLLLSHGADPNQADRSGKPPLYWPASDGYGRIVRLLLAYGADPNGADGEGSAMDWAIANGHSEVVRILAHWTQIRRHFLLGRLPRYIDLISEKDRNRLNGGHLIHGNLLYALPAGLLTAPWKSRESFIQAALKADRKHLAPRFGQGGPYPLWRKNAILELGENLKIPSATASP